MLKLILATMLALMFNYIVKLPIVVCIVIFFLMDMIEFNIT